MAPAHRFLYLFYATLLVTVIVLLNSLASVPAGFFYNMQESHTIYVNRSFPAGEHELEIAFEGKPTSLRISGLVEGDGGASVYLTDESREILVFRKDAVQSHGSSLLGKGSDNIRLNLAYAGGSRWDPDNNGVTMDNSVIDYSVAGSSVNGTLNPSNLCTEWNIYSMDENNLTSTCLGSIGCCNQLGYTGVEGSSWNETLYVYRSRYGATENNIVTAQIAYIDYNPAAGRADVFLSQLAALTATFKNITAEFKDICANSCNMGESSKTMKLRMIVDEEATLHLEKIEYTT